jgi:hypothetical protein
MCVARQLRSRSVVSPVPKHLRTEAECASIPAALREHVCDLALDASKGVKIPGSQHHRAKFPPGLATELVKIAGTVHVGDPMAGTGTLAWETGLPTVALNDIDRGMSQFLQPLARRGCTVTYRPATDIPWKRDACIFSPPYYPRTDRCVPNAHDDAKRGPVVGFRDCYNSDHPAAIGNPGGVNAILRYRAQMTDVYGALCTQCDRMIVVTKNWMRLGVELRLDLDTILMAQSVGWRLTERHGFEAKPSLWARFNADRGKRQGRTGMVNVEDVLVFDQ